MSQRIFPNTTRRRQQEAEAERLIQEIQQSASLPGDWNRVKALQAAKRLRMMASNADSQTRSNLNQLVRTLEQTQSPASNQAIDDLFSGLGVTMLTRMFEKMLGLGHTMSNVFGISTLGNLLGHSGEPTGQQYDHQQIDQIGSILADLSPDVFTSPRRARREEIPEFVGVGVPIPVAKKIPVAYKVQDEPEDAGPGTTGRLDFDDREEPEPGVSRDSTGTHVTINRPGFRRRYKINDPVVTGAMIPVVSTNVRAIGFRFNLQNPKKSLLIVQYHQGPTTYGYKDVHPDLFTAFVKALSKGKFVWDELRIRGTVAGAQYIYSLIRAGREGGNPYIPRRATLFDGGEQWFMPRSKAITGSQKRISSQRNGRSLGAQYVGPYRPKSGRPNRGNPSRGTPPNRGR